MSDVDTSASLASRFRRVRAAAVCMFIACVVSACTSSPSSTPAGNASSGSSRQAASTTSSTAHPPSTDNAASTPGCPLTLSQVRSAVSSTLSEVAAGTLDRQAHMICEFLVQVTGGFDLSKPAVGIFSLSTSGQPEGVTAGTITQQPQWGAGAVSYSYSSNVGMTEMAYFGSYKMEVGVTSSLAGNLSQIVNELVQDTLKS